MLILITAEAKETLDFFARRKFPDKTTGAGLQQLPCGNYAWDIHPLILLDILDAHLEGESFSDTIIRVLHIDGHGLQ